MSHLEIRLLGPIQVHLDGQPVTRFRADSVRALLAYLAIHRGLPLRREALAGLLWPDQPDKVARDNLRQVLSLLRTAIGDRAATPPYLLVSRTTVAFNPESDYWLDVGAFSDAMATTHAHFHRQLETCAACANRLAEAVELYRGDLLAGFSLPSALFEEWMVVEREHLHGQALEALGHLAAYHEAQGAYEQAVRYARRQLDLEPWCEEARQTLMRVLALSGQRSAALAQYEACCTTLQEELGIEPSEETSALYRQIRGGQDLTGLGKPVRSVDSNLPAQLTPFIGRQRELAMLGWLLADPEVRLVTVVGPGGSGKTRLALEAARAALDRYPDGTWLVELAPVPDGASVPRAVAAALRVREHPHQPLPETIAGALQGRELLLLLDNCEHVLDGLAPLAALLLARCPELALLATSREPLHIAGEHLYDLPPMALPETDDEPTVLAADAVQLFGQRAAAVRPGFALAGDNLAPVADLCRRLDGMPLAIELAAARLRALSLPELARHLDDRFRLLTGGDRAALPRQQTLRNTVAWSYDLLSAGERLLFDRLSIFAGSFDLESAEEVCSGEGVAREEVLELVAALVDQSMVVRVESPKARGRYRLLETLRAYGQQRLGEREETEQVAARHTWYYVSLTEKLEPVLWDQEKGVIAASQRLDAEADNLLRAMRWSLAHGQPEAVLRIGGALACWVGERIGLVQLVEHLRCALSQAKGTAPLYRVKALDVLNQHAQWLGRAEEALATAQEELALARTVGDPKWIAAAMLSMASATRLTGEHQAQRAYLQKGAALARQHGEGALLVWASVGLALHEPPRQRQTQLEELLPVAPYYLRAYVRGWLALAVQALGDLDKAQAHAERSLAAYMQVGDTLMVARALLTVAGIVALRGDNVRAERLFGRMRHLSRRDGHHLMTIEATQALGHLAWQQGELERASSCFQEALDLARQHSYPGEGALARLGLALVAVERGEHGRAEALCAQAVPGLPERDDQAQALAQCARGRAALRRSQWTRAVESYRRALERARRSESRPDTVEVLEFLAWALGADGRAVEAARLLALAEREREDMGMVLPPVDQPRHDRAVWDASAALGEEGFAAAWAEGQARELEATASDLLAELEADRPEQVEAPTE